MIVKGILTEDFINYKKPCMTIEFPKCTFKCDKENGNNLCQNYALQFEQDIDISYKSIVDLYMENTITKAIVFQGLEPFYDKKELYELIKQFRQFTDDDIVIYTGFTEEELKSEIPTLQTFGNIVIKFGRYRPNQEKHYDEVLGVYLASGNQYGKRL